MNMNIHSQKMNMSMNMAHQNHAHVHAYAQHAVGRTLRTAENSHLVQLHTDATTLWRGEEWSKLSVFMRINQNALNSVACSRSRSYSRVAPQSLKVSTFIEHSVTCTEMETDTDTGRGVRPAHVRRRVIIHHPLNHDKSKFKMTMQSRSSSKWNKSNKDGSGCGGGGGGGDHGRGDGLILSDIIQDIRGCSEMNLELHKDLFSHGDAFRVVVALSLVRGAEQKEGGDGDGDVIGTRIGVHHNMRHLQRPHMYPYGSNGSSSAVVAFGATQYIAVTNHTLHIQHCFQQSEKIVPVPENENAFVFYKDVAPRHEGLLVTIRMLDETGTSCAAYLPSSIKLKTELLYENNVPAPLVPYGKRVSGMVFDTSKGELLKRRNGEPILGRGVGTHDFCFQIQQVTFHHHGYDGFKIKVSLEGSGGGAAGAAEQGLVIHPGIMKEIVAVLSKPKKMTMKMMKASERKLATPSRRRPLMIVKHSGLGSPIATLAKAVQSRCANTKKRKSSDMASAPCEKQHAKKKKNIHEGPQKVHNNASECTPVVVEKEGPPNFLPIPISGIITAYHCNGKCLDCHALVDHCNFFAPSFHNHNCKIARRIFPILGAIKVSAKREIVSELPPILKSESFDETLDSWRTPKIDASIFEDRVEYVQV